MKKQNYWFVLGARGPGSPNHPMVTGYDNDGTLYFGNETTLFKTYALARSAIAQTKRRSPDILLEIKRGYVRP